MESEPIFELVGFFIEYRIKRKKDALLSEYQTKRKVRSTNEDKNEGWEKLVVIPRNVTSFSIQPSLPVYRGTNYEFRICALTSFSFSAPSSSVEIDTAG